MKEISLFDIPDEDERGVSPVIGVILMVAITVILAAVIASFVLGFGSSVSQSTNAGATIEATEGGTDGEVVATWIEGGNANHLNVSVSGDTANLTNSGDLERNINTVGETVTFSEDSTNMSTASDTKIRVTVTAVGESGSRTVVQQKTVTI